MRSPTGEVHLSQSCTLNKIWYYSPPGVDQLATECGVWDMSTQRLIAENTSPSWSGTAGSGWISCAFTGVTLPVGKYKVAVYNGAATPVPWSAKRLNYWDIGPGQNGITNGRCTHRSWPTPPWLIFTRDPVRSQGSALLRSAPRTSIPTFTTTHTRRITGSTPRSLRPPDQRTARDRAARHRAVHRRVAPPRSIRVLS